MGEHKGPSCTKISQQKEKKTISTKRGKMAPSLASPSISILVATHLALAFAYYFQTWPAEPSSLLIYNKPGTGETPVERVLALLLCLLYLVTILPLLLSQVSKLDPHAALLCPALFHLARICTYVLLPDWVAAFHKGPNSGLAFHTLMLFACFVNHPSL